jgi:hypothetical protein
MNKLNYNMRFFTTSTQINNVTFQNIGNLYLRQFNDSALQQLIKPKKSNLIISGNISYINNNIFKLLTFASINFEKVFYVPGIMELSNENTNYTVDELVETLQICCSKYYNVEVLSNSSYNWTDYDLQIVGSTYWGNVKQNKLFMDSQYYSKMYDKYRKLMTPDMINELHTNSVKYLSKLDLRTNKILISHYPMYTTNSYDLDGIQYIPFKNNINNIIKSVDSTQ